MGKSVAGRLSIEGLGTDWCFPTTRYRGSKRKILPWLQQSLADLNYDSVLDLFGGTASVSLLFKRLGKQVTYNDYLTYNYLAGIALIENQATKLLADDLEFILTQGSYDPESRFIFDTFRGFYFLDDENRWLDRVISRIEEMNHIYSGVVLRRKQALAIWALGQACLIKRPFNLFHRKNLNLRTREVDRSFGNKTTWETQFSTAFCRFSQEANESVFNNRRRNTSLRSDAFKIKSREYDLVYIDPPYFFEGQKDHDYREVYHFLEGLSQYELWPDLIDYSSTNLRLRREDSMQWPHRSPSQLRNLYFELLDQYRASLIVISHRSGNLVSIKELSSHLEKQGRQVRLHEKPYTYALSKKNGRPNYNTEWILVAI